MVERVKIEPEIIVIDEGRLSFFRADKATYRTKKDGTLDKGTPEKPKKPQYRWTWLLDPSNAKAAATIAKIKAEAIRQLDLFFNGRANWPKDNPTTGTKGIITCFGEANKLPKIYDGYKDMFYVKVADTTRPIIGDRRGRAVQFVEGDGSWHYVDKASGNTTEEVADPGEIPYGGAYARGRISLYVFNNESAGVNANARSAQFLRPGQAFGGGGRRSADEELEQMAGDAPAGSQQPAGFDDDIPF